MMQKVTKLAPLWGVVLVFGLTLWGCEREEEAEAPEAIEENTAASEEAAEAVEEVLEAESEAVDEGTETAMVGISHDSFSPATLSIGAGDAVRFLNTQRMPPAGHTVVADDGSFSSPALEENQVWEHTFDEAGTYSFHLEEHPNVKGAILVGD